MSTQKKGGALQAPIPNLNSPQHKIGSAFPQPLCAHPATYTERLPDGYAHYAQLKCAICQRHLRWLPRPENVERAKLMGFKLARLALCNELTPWQRNFVRDVLQRRKLSPKQQEIVERLAAQYLSKDGKDTNQ